MLKVFPFKVNSREINKKRRESNHSCLDLIYNPAKYNQNISKGIRVMEHLSHSRKITQTGSKKEEHFFLHVTCCLDLLTISINHQHISKGIGVIMCTFFPL